MSKSNTRPSETNNNTTNKDQILTYVQPKLHNLTQDITSNVSTATFSSMSKQAESLVSGGNNVLFNPYNNNLVFQWVSMNMNDCLSIDIINRTLLNLMSLKFVNNGEIRGISDGFTVDSRGQIVQIYDPTIALSCAFGYKIQTESDETAGRLNIEIERRQLDFETLLNKYKETDANAIHAESMIHYIDFDLTNHVMKFMIPVEDETGTLSFGDTLPAETIEMGDIKPGVYDPTVGIDEVEKRGFVDKEVVNVSKDGVLIDGLVAATGGIFAMSGFTFPAYSIVIEETTYECPEMLVLGVAQSFELSVDFLIPSVKAVYDHVTTVTKAMMEVISADFDAKQQLIDLNASMIDGIKNSCGGYEDEIDEYSTGSKDWRMWVFARRWIVKALSDSLQGLNGPEWEDNLPSLKDKFDSYTFGPEWKDQMSLSGSGSEHTIKIGHEETMTRRDVCNLYVDGAADAGVVVGKDSYSGIYSHNWLVVHGFTDYKNTGVHFLCEGVARFTNAVKFEGSVEGLNFAPLNHTHTYESLTDKPDVYTKIETDARIDEKINAVMSGVTDDIDKLKSEIQALNNKINELLITIKDMNTYEEVLFRLIDLTKDIMNIKTTCGNLDSRIIALENSKSDVDAVKQSVVELQTWKTTTDQTLTALDERVTALENT